jgi:hypothetical protein
LWSGVVLSLRSAGQEKIQEKISEQDKKIREKRKTQKQTAHNNSNQHHAVSATAYQHAHHGTTWSSSGQRTRTRAPAARRAAGRTRSR